jgi:hypothetical protein
VLKKKTTIPATIGVAVGTSHLAVVRNFTSHQRHRLPTPG